MGSKVEREFLEEASAEAWGGRAAAAAERAATAARDTSCSLRVLLYSAVAASGTDSPLLFAAAAARGIARALFFVVQEGTRKERKRGGVSVSGEARKKKAAEKRGSSEASEKRNRAGLSLPCFFSFRPEIARDTPSGGRRRGGAERGLAHGVSNWS